MVTGFNLLEFSAKQKNGDFSGGLIYRGKFLWLNVARATGSWSRFLSAISINDIIDFIFPMSFENMSV